MTSTIKGTTLKVATMNDDWASAGTNAALVVDVRDVHAKAPAPTDDCDVVFVQEGKRAKYRELVGNAFGVKQDTSTKALAGSVLIWRRGKVELTVFGWTFLVRALGLLGRYLVWGRGTVGDRDVFFGSAHRPPKRAARWWRPFDAALALRCRRARRAGRLVIIGMDANQVEPERLAKMCRLVWHSIPGRCIDGFLASPQIQVVEIHELPKGTSDHHPLVATVVIPAKRDVRKPAVAAPPAFEHVIYNGRLMDQKTKAFVQRIEKRLGYPLTILQGCYNPGGVSASAGTHDGGGVVDLAPWDVEHKDHAWRAEGGFGWHRLPIPGVWGEHYHGGIRDHGRLSPAAQAQQRDYDAHPARDGLAGHGLDPTWHPSPPVDFAYPGSE